MSANRPRIRDIALTNSMLQIALVVALDFQHGTESCLERVVRRRVDHALLNGGISGRPGWRRSIGTSSTTFIMLTKYAPVYKQDLATLATIIRVELEIVHRPSALVVGELLEERLVIWVVGRLQNDDFRELGVESEDDVFVLPLQEFLVLDDALICNRDAGRGLVRDNMSIARLKWDINPQKCADHDV